MGISGCFGILDVVECRLMFSVLELLVIGIIVGGDGVIKNVIEGVEDDNV